MSSGDAAAARRQLGVGPAVPLVVFTLASTGRSAPSRRCRIFAAVAGDVPDALLVFIGGARSRTRSSPRPPARGLAGRVVMAGYQTNIADWLAAATVWLLPTERENFSVAVLEAMAAGCTVLSTTCKGNNEVLVDGVNRRHVRGRRRRLRPGALRRPARRRGAAPAARRRRTGRRRPRTRCRTWSSSTGSSTCATPTPPPACGRAAGRAATSRRDQAQLLVDEALLLQALDGAQPVVLQPSHSSCVSSADV